LAFVYTLHADRAENEEAQRELDQFLGVVPKPSEREVIRNVLAEFGEVTVERG